jgi:phytanoyl-CoA hydroxylase
VLLPGVEELPLSEPLARFRRDGFARLGQVLAPEALAALRRRADAIMLGEVPHQPFFFQLDAASGRYDDLPYGQGWQGPSLAYRKIEKLERDPVFRQLIDNPLFARIAHALIGPAVSLCRAVLFTKAASGGSELPWHQDGGPFWGLTRDPELQIWTALDDAPEEAGCLELVPQSHAAGLATPHGGVIKPEVLAESAWPAKALRLPARAGESILLHNHCWHRSMNNRTPHPRRALTVCLMDAAIRCTRRRSPRQFVRLFPSAG